MRQTLSITCLLFAWLCANGALLDAVQVFAWGKMFAENVRTEPLGEALRATFDPAKPCQFCLGVAAAKETAKQQLPGSVDGASAFVVFAPTSVRCSRVVCAGHSP